MSDLGIGTMSADLVFVLGSAIVSSIALDQFTARDGETNRGFTISTQPLPDDMLSFLRDLADGHTCENDSAFILKRDHTVLVQPIPRRIRKDPKLPLVGFIDLDAPAPVIEYRLSVGWVISFAAILALMLATFWLDDGQVICILGANLFMLAFVFLSYALGRSRVRKYIESCMEPDRVRKRP